MTKLYKKHNLKENVELKLSAMEQKFYVRIKFLNNVRVILFIGMIVCGVVLFYIPLPEYKEFKSLIMVERGLALIVVMFGIALLVFCSKLNKIILPSKEPA